MFADTPPRNLSTFTTCYRSRRTDIEGSGTSVKISFMTLFQGLTSVLEEPEVQYVAVGGRMNV